MRAFNRFILFSFKQFTDGLFIRLILIFICLIKVVPSSADIADDNLKSKSASSNRKLNYVIGQIESAGANSFAFDSLVDEQTGKRVFIVGLQDIDLQGRVLIHSASPLILRDQKYYILPDQLLPAEVSSEFAYEPDSIEIFYAERLVREKDNQFDERFGHGAIRVGDRVYNFYGGPQILNSFFYITDLPTFLFNKGYGYQNRRDLNGIRFHVKPDVIVKMRNHLEKIFGMADNSVAEYSNLTYNCLFPIKEALKSVGIKFSNVAPYDFFLKLRKQIAKNPQMFSKKGLNYIGEYSYKQTYLSPDYTSSKNPSKFNPTNWGKTKKPVEPFFQFPSYREEFALLGKNMSRANLSGTKKSEVMEVLSSQKNNRTALNGLKELCSSSSSIWDGVCHQLKKYILEELCDDPQYQKRAPCAYTNPVVTFQSLCAIPEYKGDPICQRDLIVTGNGIEEASYFKYDTYMALRLFLSIQNIRNSLSMLLLTTINEMSLTGRLRDVVRNDLSKILSIPVEMIPGQNGVVFNVDEKTVHELWNSQSLMPPVPPQYRLPLIETLFNRKLRGVEI